MKLDDVEVPATPACRAALEVATAYCSRALLNHSVRAHLWAAGYGLERGIAFDAELLYVSAMLHDLALVKRHVGVGHFVELRIDSPRFSVHEDAPEKCACPTCNGEATKPILRHEHPATLLPLPKQNVPSRGWGEDSWVRVTERKGQFFKAIVDNPLYEARLHVLCQGDEIVFHEDHILAVHGVHRQELVLGMGAADLKELAQWLGSQ